MNTLSLAAHERRTFIVVVALFAICVAAVACSSPFGPSGCAGVGYYAVRIAITDQYGEPQALGATVTLTDGPYLERNGSESDPLNVFGASERGGRTYDIRVSKPFYNDVVVNGVRAPGGACKSGTVTVPITITLVPGAPAVRSLHLVPGRVLLDRPPNTGSFAFRPYVDANPGISRGVSWTIVGDTASVGFDAASGTITYRCRPTSGYLTVTARSLIDPAVFDTASVAVQGHPALTNDPPCS